MRQFARILIDTGCSLNLATSVDMDDLMQSPVSIQSSVKKMAGQKMEELRASATSTMTFGGGVTYDSVNLRIKIGKY